MTTLELVRILAVVAAGGLVAMALVVVTDYGRRWQDAVGIAKALPSHVAMVGASYLLLVGVTAGDQWELLIRDAPPTWRLAVLPLAYALGVLGLLRLLKHLQHARRRS